MIDYMVCVVLAFMWVRFFYFMYFSEAISKMLITLLAMLWDVMEFLFIMVIYIIMAMLLLQTLYQDRNDDYRTTFQSFVTTFDHTLGAYSYVGAGGGGGEIIYTMILFGHLFILNILLLNFMIAILSTTFESMSESGSFQYKRKLFQYCEKYMLAFEDPRFGELVLYAPPLNIFSALMIPCAFVP